MNIVPFARVNDCRPADIAGMLRYIRKGLRASGARAGTVACKVCALATSFCVALGWAVGFLEII
eukprot:8807991-Pyramimonas_sp.AAC.1